MFERVGQKFLLWYLLQRSRDGPDGEKEIVQQFVDFARFDMIIFEQGGFGWDSIFVPNGESEPFSCLSTDEKNKLSHRGNAVRQWARWLSVNKDELLKRQGGEPAIGHKGLDFKPNFVEQ